jgi:lysophospholipase L1-like esterase
LLVLFQVIFLSAALTSWWAQKNNHIFGNEHWLVGKNMGKFVFYTFQFMFRPIENGRINLNSEMGNQELLYHLPEDDSRRLTQLTFESAVSSNTYLWIELQKTQNGMLACRLSRTSKYKSGFYKYNSVGELTQYIPLENEGFIPSESWSSYRLSRENDIWLLFNESERIGSISDDLPAEGYFGFRGSGNISGKTFVRNISISFIDPRNSTVKWEYDESFRSSDLQSSILFVIIAVAIVFTAARCTRQNLIIAELSLTAGRRYFLWDNGVFVLLLMVLFVLPSKSLSIFIPASLVGGELISVRSFWLARRYMKNAGDRRSSVLVPYVSLIVLCVLFASGFVRHGEWLGRVDRSIWSNLENIHPSAFILSPSGKNRPPHFTVTTPRELVPGKPLYTQESAFRYQQIEVDFEMPTECTFDLVFQQQSYQTFGDPKGELLPLQRRLLRLSTRQDVPWGLSTRSRTQTAPFLKINGEIHTDRINTLSFTQNKDTFTLVLNGAVTVVPDFNTLGYGETGFSVFEKNVVLHRVDITALENETRQRFVLPLLGFILPIGAALLLWLLLFPLTRASFSRAVRLTVITLFIPGMFIVFSLPLATNELVYLGSLRLAWLDLTLIGAALSLFHLFPLFHGQIRQGAIVSNVLLLALFSFVGLFTWDYLLPDNHPLRLRFDHNVVAPADAVQGNHDISSTWYSNNRLAVANTYVWHQHFGGKPVTVPKPENSIRIFTMGGSQAWGSGAADSESTYAALLEDKLQAQGYEVEIYNGGVNGAGISRVYTSFRDLILPFEPDLLILDVGLNDSVALGRVGNVKERQKMIRRIMENYTALLQLCRRNKVSLILVHEAMNMESALRKNTRVYGRMAELTANAGFLVLDSYTYFAETQADYMYWWDPAHFSPMGHQAFAAYLYPHVENILKTEILTEIKGTTE